MKIYTEVVFEWSEEENQMVEVSSESIEYDGPVALCGSGPDAKTTDPEAIRRAMLRDMPIEQMEQLFGQAQSRSDEMWGRTRQMLDPESELNQRMKANVMGQSQDMIATQTRMAQAQAARAGMSGSGIAAQQAAQIGLQGQQQGLMAVQNMLDQQQRGALGFAGASAAQQQLAGGALGMQATAIGGANQAVVNTMLQNTANRQSAENTGYMGTMNVVGGALAGMSDRRMKKDIKLLGKNSQDYNVYQFRYIYPLQDIEDKTLHVGVMADELPKELTYIKNNINYVHYENIDLKGFV